MKRETIEKILNFLKEKEGHKLPEEWFDSVKKYKIIEKLENHPDGVQYKYDGNLNLSNTTVTKLPNDLYVNGKLDLSGCKQLTELPDNLRVEIDLDLNNSGVLGFPNNLYVGRNLWLYEASLADKYTNEEIYEIVASKGGTIKGRIIRYF
jgi:hypothetical protein